MHLVFGINAAQRSNTKSMKNPSTQNAEKKGDRGFHGDVRFRRSTATGKMRHKPPKKGQNRFKTAKILGALQKKSREIIEILGNVIERGKDKIFINND